jgi:hypothetical protein
MRKNGICLIDDGDDDDDDGGGGGGQAVSETRRVHVVSGILIDLIYDDVVPVNCNISHSFDCNETGVTNLFHHVVSLENAQRDRTLES